MVRGGLSCSDDSEDHFGSAAYLPVAVETVSQSHNRARVILSGRLCENSVHGSTKLTTNDSVSLEINYLSVRPEPSRRAPREFLHSLAVAKDLLFLRCSRRIGVVFRN
jgi:hypothetical protein